MIDQQVRDEAMTLLLAGHETPANGLAWIGARADRRAGAADHAQAEEWDSGGGAAVAVV